jgi:hypothetical protein
MKFGFCTTTINVPYFLDEFSSNFKINNHNEIIFYIIGDYKTPPKVKSYVKNLSKKYRFDYRYYDVNKIKKIFKKYPKLRRIIKFYSGQMKFIGVFLSYIDNCDICLQIDDDNFNLEKDYLSVVKKIFSNTKFKTIESRSGWVNIYNFLKEKNNLPLYPRAYPWSQRFKKEILKIKETKSQSIFFNGTVFGDPDIDAIARLYANIEVIGFKNKNFVQWNLSPKTWTSFNNQNSGLVKDLVPAYFTPYSTGRNADIWASYMICKIASLHKKIITFGKPAVRQIRNPHNLWKDLNDEFQNDYLTDYFVDFLKKLKIKKGLSYLLTCKKICQNSIKFLTSDKKFSFNKKDKKYILNFFREYLIWISLFEK